MNADATRHRPQPMSLPQALTLLLQPDRHGSLADRDLEALTEAALRLYGRYPNLELFRHVAPLFTLYQDRVPYDRLDALYERLLEGVATGALNQYTILPFLFVQPSPLVSKAARDGASACPLAGGDPLAGPRTMLDLFRRQPPDERRPWLFAGLLMLGDRRVYELLREARGELTVAELETVAEVRTQFRYAGQAEFWLGWLEELAASGDERRFALAALALARLGSAPPAPGVLDVRRNFPLPEAAQPIEILGMWSVVAYGRLIAGRLRTLAGRQPEVMMPVLESWGV